MWFFLRLGASKRGLSGGLLLAWRHRQQVQIIYESQNLVHTEVMDNKGNPLSITFVHGHPDHSKREFVWAKLRELKFLSHPNWLCIGDFNQILDSKDKFSFFCGKTPGIEAFQRLVFDLELCELASSSQTFTKMNNRMDEELVMERLD